jgi:hypothetical protein
MIAKSYFPAVSSALIAALAVPLSHTALTAQFEVETTVEFIRDENGPDELSGITRGSDARWWAVDDRTGKLYPCRVGFDRSGSVEKFEVSEGVGLEGCSDAEGCAADPLRADIVYISDEKNTSVTAHDVKTGKRVEKVVLPEEFRSNVRWNRSIEALCISPDGLRLWAANEDTLKCDGECATDQKGGTVRILAFTRKGAGAPWKFSGWSRYPTDAIGGKPFRNRTISGLVSLADLGDGSLLALEREMSRKNPLFPSFRSSLYRFLPAAAAGGEVAKELLWGDDVFFSNYEGMALCPADGGASRRLVLVSDGGGEAVESVRTLILKEN